MLALLLLVPLALPQEPEGAADAARERAWRLGMAHVAAAPAEWPRPEDGQPPKALVHEVETRLEHVAEELRKADPDLPEWAGSYRAEDGMEGGVLLAVAPESGLGFLHFSDVGGAVVDANHGPIAPRPDAALEVRFAAPLRQRARLEQAGLPRVLYAAPWHLVPWGEDRYLVPRPALVAFCNAVNAGGEDVPRFFRKQIPGQPVRTRSRAPAPPGLPSVPEEFAPFLLAAPLEGTLLDVAEPERLDGGAVLHPELEFPALLDLGARDGLLPGMVLHGLGEASPVEAEVLELEEDRALLAIRTGAWSSPRRTPRVGWRFSTRRPAR